MKRHFKCPDPPHRQAVAVSEFHAGLQYEITIGCHGNMRQWMHGK